MKFFLDFNQGEKKLAPQYEYKWVLKERKRVIF
jgi:hypothetical protein